RRRSIAPAFLGAMLAQSKAVSRDVITRCNCPFDPRFCRPMIGRRAKRHGTCDAPQIVHAMAKKVFTCRHCSLSIEPGEIVVLFHDAEPIHVRCWPVNDSNGRHPPSMAPPSSHKESTSSQAPKPGTEHRFGLSGHSE